MENLEASIAKKPSKLKSYFAKLDKKALFKTAIILTGACILVGAKPTKAHAGVLSDYILNHGGAVRVLTKGGTYVIVRGKYILAYISSLHPMLPEPETIGYGFGDYSKVALGIGVGCGIAGMLIDSIVKE